MQTTTHTEKPGRRERSGRDAFTAPSDAPEILRGSAVEQAALVRSGEVSARELVEASLARIDSLNPVVNAFVALCADRALAEADRIRPGDPRPLCGVPVAIKDLFIPTAGVPTSHGSSAFGSWLADHDGAHVQRLREAGAILVGKTNTPELGLRPVTENERFGATRNPWNPALSPGGSSGGSAAAVAAGLVALADGSDLGGSIRIPASCCGLVGLKPSRGTAVLDPVVAGPAADAASVGALTRTVLDTAVALDLFARRVLPSTRPGRFVRAAQRPPARVAVRVAPAAPHGLTPGEEPLAAVTRTADALAGLGHDVAEHTPDWDDETFPAAWATYTTAVLQRLIPVLEQLHRRPLEPELLEPATRRWLHDAAPVPAADYRRARERLGAFARRVLRSWPADTLLLTPTLTRLPAPVGSLQARAGTTDDALAFSALARIWNATGQPAISLPLHVTGNGVPVGVQLVGPPGRDDLLIGLAAQLEHAVGLRPQARLADPTR